MAKKSKDIMFGLSSSVLYIIIGVLLAVFQSEMLKWAMTIVGIVLVVSGIVDLSKRYTASGTTSLIIGALILVLGWKAVDVVLLVLGVLIAVKGLVGLIDVFKLPKKKRTAIRIIFPILTVVVGLALAFGNGLNNIMLIIGVLLIIDGILGLVGSR